MPEADPVEVIVEIIDQFTDEIVKLKRELESIEDILDILLLIDDNGQIQIVGARLDALERDRFVNLYIREHRVGGDGDGGGGGGLVDRTDYDPKFAGFQRAAVNNMFAEGITGTNVRLGRRGAASMMPKQLPLLEQLGRFFRRGDDPADNVFRKLNDGIKRMIPSWHTWVSLIAFLIPMLITLAVAAGGVATAFGAVALAGAAIAGLGLIGEGDSMAESFENAKRKIDEFKEALFETFQPVARIFAPFSEEIFDVAPTLMRGFANSLEELIVFADDFQRMLRGVFNWLERATRATASFEYEIDAILTRFGPGIGDAIINFFSFLVTEVFENQEALAKLGQTFIDIAHIVYNLSKAFAFIITALKPLTELLAWLTDHLDNRLAIALGTALLIGVLFGKMFYGISHAILGFIKVLGLMNIQLAITNAMLAKAVILMSALTLGAAAVAGIAAWRAFDSELSAVGGGGGPPSVGGAVGSGSVTNITMNVDGDVTKRHRTKLEDLSKRTYNNEREFSQGSSWQ